LSFGQKEATELVRLFTDYVVSNEIDSARSLCTEFGKVNYFENRKHIKYMRFEFFKNVHDLSLAEFRNKEYRVQFRSGKDSLLREVYVKQFDEGWKMITKIELVEIKNFYLSLEVDSNVIYRGWNTVKAIRVDVPFQMHMLYNYDDLYIMGLEIHDDLRTKIIAGEKIDGNTTSIVLVEGNVLPLEIKESAHGTATINQVEHNPQDLSLLSYTIEGSFTTLDGHVGKFRMKTVLE
jgi:hypothetical protein